MKSLHTPVSPTLCGAAINGTDKPYVKVIYDMDVEATTDQINVRLFLGCQEDEDWTDEEWFVLVHESFERWLDKNSCLDYDDTHTVADCTGVAVEYGEACTVSYTDYLMHHLRKTDVIRYMKERKIIPDYIIDPDLTKE